MSTVQETAPQRDRTVIYLVTGAIVAIAMILGVIVFDYAKDNAAAEDHANELIAALHKAGYPAPSQEQIVKSLGSDGGAVCTNPDDNLSRAILYSQLTNGAAGPGTRPVVVDRKVVAGQLLIISIYCPDHLTDFQQRVADLKFDNVTGG